jgi:hypothetical protein
MSLLGILDREQREKGGRNANSSVYINCRTRFSFWTPHWRYSQNYWPITICIRIDAAAWELILLRSAFWKLATLYLVGRGGGGGKAPGREDGHSLSSSTEVWRSGAHPYASMACKGTTLLFTFAAFDTQHYNWLAFIATMDCTIRTTYFITFATGFN